MFREGPIEGVKFRPLERFRDQRGWLTELFRHDELERPFHPVMAYLSVTMPGVARGPHEHRQQADYFCFLGPSNFKLYLWDNRPQSPTYRHRQVVVVGADNPQAVLVPAGVTHAYKNVGSEPGTVINCPNRLYRGPGKSQQVDEVRYEDCPDSPFQLD